MRLELGGQARACGQGEERGVQAWGQQSRQTAKDVCLVCKKEGIRRGIAEEEECQDEARVQGQKQGAVGGLAAAEGPRKETAGLGGQAAGLLRSAFNMSTLSHL